uniref:Uncharacterized protein n=1 Tax=Kudoa septempunctata TaxID=751907 RepID=A0A0H5B159_9CNID|nr:unnamed protein product [Kudoa septempunctata]BAR94680.1 unnamed protein product [Kudoa septempunctata]
MLTNSSFRLGESLIFCFFCFLFSNLLFLFCEESFDAKFLLALGLALFSLSLLSPFVGVALMPLPGVTILRPRLHLVETTGCPENQKSFLKIKSLLVLFLQSFVTWAVFFMRTGHFLLS